MKKKLMGKRLMAAGLSVGLVAGMLCGCGAKSTGENEHLSLIL